MMFLQILRVIYDVCQELGSRYSYASQFKGRILTRCFLALKSLEVQHPCKLRFPILPMGAKFGRLWTSYLSISWTSERSVNYLVSSLHEWWMFFPNPHLMTVTIFFQPKAAPISTELPSPEEKEVKLNTRNDEESIRVYKLSQIRDIHTKMDNNTLSNHQTPKKEKKQFPHPFSIN